MDRRTFLASALAGLGGTLLPRRARAAGSVAGRDLQFLFVTCFGGWDPTRVYAPVFGSADVDMEPGATTAQAGNIAYVDHAERPSVRAVFEGWHDRMLVLNGTLVEAVSHPSSLRRLFTGGAAEAASDWPTLLASANASPFALPSLVISGPSYPGALGEVVCRTGTSGQLAALLAGTLAAEGDLVATAPSAAAEARIARYLSERTQGLLDHAVGARDQQLLRAILDGLTRGEGLKSSQTKLDWSSTATFSEQAGLAVDVLALGLSRCVTLDYTLWPWDSHSGNDWYQTRNFEGLYAELLLLLHTMDATPGRLGGTVAEETVVVVVSEMGRCPKLNPSEGKDHWPYTSGLLIGPNLTTDRVVGAFDAGLYGSPVDMASGDATDTGDDLTPQVVGATILALGDVDPGDSLPGVPVLDGVLTG